MAFLHETKISKQNTWKVKCRNYGKFYSLLRDGLSTILFCIAELLIISQLAHAIRTTLLQRGFNVLTSFQRPYNVVLTLCADRDPMCTDVYIIY